MISQTEIDAAAVVLYPAATTATRNRQVYSPMSAILKRAGVETALKRPKGGRGRRRADWLTPDQFFALHAAAEAMHPRFAACLLFLTYCGPSLSEAMRLEWSDVDLSAGVAILRRTKNGDPQSCHLPPAVIAALANLPQDRQRVFGLAKSGRLYALLAQAKKASGVTIPKGVAFHILRHSYGAWMRRYGGADSSALLATGRWKDRQSVEVYEHVDVTAEARRADLLPTRAKSVRKGREHG